MKTMIILALLSLGASQDVEVSSPEGSGPNVNQQQSNSSSDHLVSDEQYAAWKGVAPPSVAGYGPVQQSPVQSDGIAQANSPGYGAPVPQAPDPNYGSPIPPVPNSRPAAIPISGGQTSAAIVAPPAHVSPIMPMPYAFQYAVKDDSADLNFGHSANSDGTAVTGSYYVLLPDGRLQTVNYQADENGYVAQVTYDYEDEDNDSPSRPQAYSQQSSKDCQKSQQPQSGGYGVPVPVPTAAPRPIPNDPPATGYSFRQSNNRQDAQKTRAASTGSSPTPTQAPIAPPQATNRSQNLQQGAPQSVAEATPASRNPSQIFVTDQESNIDKAQEIPPSAATKAPPVATTSSGQPEVVVSDQQMVHQSVQPVTQVATSAPRPPALNATISVQGSPTIESPTIESPAVESPAVESSAVESSAVGSPEVAPPAVGSPIIKSSAIESPAIGSPEAGSPEAGSPTIESSAIESSAIESPAIKSPAIGSPEAGSPAVGSPEAGLPEAGSPEAEPPAVGSQPDTTRPPPAGQQSTVRPTAASTPQTASSAPSASLKLLQLQLCSSCPPKYLQEKQAQDQNPPPVNVQVQQVPSVTLAPVPDVQRPNSEPNQMQSSAGSQTGT